MMDKDFLRRQIRLILEEPNSDTPSSEDKPAEDKPAEDKPRGPKTDKIGPGRYSKKMAQTKGLADSDPSGLLKKLSIGSAKGESPSQIVNNLLNDAITKTAEMSAAYSVPSGETDTFGRKGAYIQTRGDISIRDAVIFLKLTVRAARNAGVLKFKDKVFVEKYKGGLLAYTGKGAYTWNDKAP